MKSIASLLAAVAMTAVSAQQACPPLDSFESLLKDCGANSTDGLMNALVAAGNGPVALYVVNIAPPAFPKIQPKLYSVAISLNPANAARISSFCYPFDSFSTLCKDIPNADDSCPGQAAGAIHTFRTCECAATDFLCKTAQGLLKQ